MEHNNAKIKEICENTGGIIVGGNYFDYVEEAMKEYAEYIRKQTIQKCLGCVPKETESIPRFRNEFDEGHTECREQTINNINNLI